MQGPAQAGAQLTVHDEIDWVFGIPPEFVLSGQWNFTHHIVLTWN
jgi:hypothetical protein